MIRLLIFFAVWNLIASLWTSYQDHYEIVRDSAISLKDKNRRALQIAVINTVLAVIAVVAFKFNWVISPALALYGQLWFGIGHDTVLNFRRFGFTVKAFLYTSNDQDDLNDALLDRLSNYLPYPYSGLIQWAFKLVVLYALIEIIFRFS